MRKFIFVLCFLIAISISVSAKEKFSGTDLKFEKVGVGLVLGDPLGISAKLWLNKETAFDGTLSFGSTRSFYIHSDYLFHNYDLLKSEKKAFSKKTAGDIKEMDLVFYYGGGAYLAFWNTGSIGLGARLPVGVEYLADPFDIFLELVPALSLTPSMGLGVYGGLGVRFNF